MNYYDYTIRGVIDEFILPSFNLTGVNNHILVFDRAYAQYTQNSQISSDTLSLGGKWLWNWFPKSI
ncbi:MAG: hypothetical protein IPN09_15740 [Bacteroidetes bacterium]|nr:hypothetical protein [Bacteroidota bacterium]